MNSETTRPSSSDTLRVLDGRVSVRRYSEEPVSEVVLEALLRAAFRAPTSSNIQAYSVIVVHDADTKAQLAAAVGNQRHVIDCPVFLAFCADLTRIEHAMRARGHGIDNNNLEMGLVSSIDAALVGMSAYLAAESLGLGGVMIGAVRNQPREVARLLGLPPRVYCVFGMCLGYPQEAPAQKPRMDYSAMVHRERYDADKMSAHLSAYDGALAEHYRSSGRATNQASWSHEVTEKFKTRPRDTLRQSLAELGFDFA